MSYGTLKGGADHAWENAVLSPDPKFPSGCEVKRYTLLLGRLDEDDNNLPVVLDVVLNKGAHYSSVEFFVISDKVDQILACGRMCDVLRIPGEPPRRWMDLTPLHEVMAEAHAEISLVCNAQSAIRPA